MSAAYKNKPVFIFLILVSYFISTFVVSWVSEKYFLSIDRGIPLSLAITTPFFAVLILLMQRPFWPQLYSKGALVLFFGLMTAMYSSLYFLQIKNNYEVRDELKIFCIEEVYKKYRKGISESDKNHDQNASLSSEDACIRIDNVLQGQRYHKGWNPVPEVCSVGNYQAINPGCFKYYESQKELIEGL